MAVFDYVLIGFGALMLVVFLGLPPIVIAGVAERRGRDPELWRIASLIIPIMPLLYLLSVPTLREQEEDEWLEDCADDSGAHD